VDNKLSLVTRYEAENNIKLYIADGKHRIMSFNITKDNGSNIEDVTAQPKIILNKPTHELCDGILKAGVYQYSYRVYNKHEKTSNISPLTDLINIGKDKTFTTINGLE